VTALAQRPEPPKGLPKAEKDLWREIVKSVPAGHFDAGTFPLLEEYCGQILAGRQARKMVAALPKDVSIDEFDKITRVQDRISGRIAALATKMRLAQQSTVDRRAAARKGAQDTTAETPWQNLHTMN
jgi:hypothetical protein